MCGNWNLRLTFLNIRRETLAWDALPDRIRCNRNRASFFKDLDVRDKRYKAELFNFLKKNQSGLWKEQKSGDWHGGKKSIVLQSGKQHLVIKSRSVACENLLSHVLENAQNQTGCQIKIPRFISIGSLSEQLYFPTSFRDQGNMRDLGGLIAFAMFYGVCDLHTENIQATSKGILIFDSECFINRNAKFCGIRNALQRIGIHFQHQKLRKDGSLKQFLVNAKGELEFVAGYTAMSQFLFSQKINVDLELNKQPQRILYAHSKIYMSFLQRRFVFGWSNNQLKSKWVNYRENKVPVKILEAEVKALARWNIPYFYRHFDTVYECSVKQVVEKTPDWHTLITRIRKTIRGRGNHFEKKIFKKIMTFCSVQNE